MIVLQGKDVTGLPVIALDSGMEIGRVYDLLVNTTTGIVAGFVVETRSLLKPGKFIPTRKISAIGRDMVMVEKNSVVDLDTENLIEKFSWAGRCQEQVCSVTGTVYGTVQDIIFEMPEGRILGFEVSAGIWADLHEGRRLLSWESLLEGEKDNFVIQLEEPGEFRN